MKTGQIRIETNSLTADTFLKLYASVGWEPPCAEQVKTALKHSIATFTAYDGGLPVGMVRLIGDGGMSFYVKDFAVLPACQGKGVGTMLINALERWIKDTLAPGWAVSLELISTKEAVPFYKKAGFEERPCEWDGPGMFKMIRL
jgi:Acetyltransferases